MYFTNGTDICKVIGEVDEQTVHQSVYTNKLYLSKDFSTEWKHVENDFDPQYMEVVNKILREGVDKPDRTGVGTRSITGHSFRIDISERFPLLTVKKTIFSTIIKELIWFLRGSTDETKSDTSIWTANTTSDFLKKRGLNYNQGFGGPMYGRQWRGRCLIPGEPQWDDVNKCYAEQGTVGVDQIQKAIDDIKKDPFSRRIIISNWDVNNIDRMALPPCHLLYQIVVRDEEYIDCLMYQRSADLFLGVPFNVASYAALTYIIANITGKKPGVLTTYFGDIHIYRNHMEQVKLINTKPIYPSCTMTIDGPLDINNLRPEQFIINEYRSGEWVRAPMAV